MKIVASEINSIQRKAITDFYYFEQLIDIVNTSIENKIRDKLEPIEGKISDILKDLDSDENPQHNLLSNIELLIHNNKKNEYESWRHTLWASILLKNYGDFEARFDNLCNEIKKNKIIKLSLSDLKDRGVKRAKKFLEIAANIKLTVPHEKWDELNNANKIRNVLTHSSGILKRKDDGNFQDQVLEKYINPENNLSIDYNDQIIISIEYLRSSSMLFYNLILHLCDDVNDAWMA